LRPLEFLSRLLDYDYDQGNNLFIAGGPVRDWLLERPVKDIDIVMANKALSVSKDMATASSGAFVMLDESFQVARVFAEGFSFDFSSYRGHAKTVEEDLAHRDFTINAMAVSLKKIMPHLRQTSQGLICPKKELLSMLIDPFGGVKDLEKRLIKALARDNLENDPLRLLRAFRFKAVLGFEIERSTLVWIKELAHELTRCAPERIGSELDKIMASCRAGQTLSHLYDSGLLSSIIPETKVMEGVEQPGFHHLDVLGHLFEAVSSMDKLVEDPCIKFDHCSLLKDWLKSNQEKISWLKWAAFMHDFGKPAQKAQREDGRVTFYEHDKAGAQMVKDVARRLRWSRAKQKFVSTLVRLHMRPFHLLNDLRRSGPSKRAMRRLLDETGPDYPALFLLAMADSMAGCGPMKPQGLDGEIALLFDKIHSFYLKSLKPVENNPPLLRGHDVMKALDIGPGPLVGEALQAIREAQIEGKVLTREDALDLLKRLFEKQGR